MAKPSNTAPPAPVETGWRDLREGRWAQARARFAEAIAAEATPEAFEGLSWSAWWLDDQPAVFEARERAYRLYRDAADPTGAARVAIWLACDELDFNGAVPVANGWLARAGRLLEHQPRGPAHGWLAFFEGYMAHAAGETDRTAQLARVAAELGRGFAVPDLEMLGLALEGAALVASAQVADGMRCLDEATATAVQGEAEIPISGAWACCFLVTACTAVRDYERAFEWCDRIAEFAQRYGSRYMLAFCRAEYGAIHLWRGSWKDAEAVLEASIDDFSRSRPAMVSGPMVALAELRRRQGRRQDASRLAEQAGSAWSAQICLARLALDEGDTSRAVELAERYLRQAVRKLDRAPALELLVQARAARGELDRARSALEALSEVADAAGTDPLRASVELAGARIATACGDHDRARTLLEDASDRFARSGGPFDAALTRLELAAVLSALGRADASAREAAVATERLRELGAEHDADRARHLLGGDAATSPGGPLVELSPREREVLRLLASGLTNRQIAERLTISEHTVHRHVTNLLRKLALPSRTAAAALAGRIGLLEERSA